jgi:hypothetical protein
MLIVGLFPLDLKHRKGSWSNAMSDRAGKEGNKD